MIKMGLRTHLPHKPVAVDTCSPRQ